MEGHRVGRAIAGLVVILTIVPMAYYAVGAAIDPGALVDGGDGRPAHVYAGYMAARNVPIALGLAVLLAARSWRLLGYLAGLVGAIQALDVVVGAAQGQVAQTVFPALYAAALLAVGVWLVRTASISGRPPRQRKMVADDPVLGYESSVGRDGLS
jgi:hypothetical protein